MYPQRTLLGSPSRRGSAHTAHNHASASWLPYAFLLLFIMAALVITALHGSHFPFQRWLFLTLLAVAAELIPVIGPRGRRLDICDGVGLACLLLLPVTLAPMPMLLAGGLLAFFGRTQISRRRIFRNTIAHGGAIFVGGAAFHVLGMTGGVVVYLIAQMLLHAWPRARRRLAFGLETAALAATVPAALLMALLWPKFGLLGGIAGAILMGLLLVIAHFAFEASLLREQVQAMERLGAVTLGQDSMTRLIERFLQMSSALASSERASLWIADSSHLRLERIARVEARWSAGEGERTQALAAGSAVVRFGEGLVGRVADRQLSLIVEDGASDKRVTDAERENCSDTPYSLLLLPLVIGGKILGVAQFERDDPHSYTRRDVNRVRTLVNQAAVTISNAQQHRAITDQAVTDGLTGLFNRRHIQATLESEYRRAQRYGHEISVIMMDVDHFKSYNDTYGHIQGDVLIRMVAGLLRANIRAVDVVGRYGGEEFIVLMPETTKEEAAITAERLRQAMATTAFPGFVDDPEVAVQKTISLGVATLPEDAGDTSMLVNRADQALYEAKRGGRNRVMIATGPASTPTPINR